MNDISNALDLIATARDALLNDLLPKLQKDQRYTALMIANALAIAQREQQESIDVTRDEIGRLVNLFAECGIEAAPAGSDSPTNEIRGLRRTLCRAIRGGRFDDASNWTALVAHLERTTADWVAISNPKALRTDRATG
jgi:Domain of unknown function (DUF6285)